MNGDRRTRGEAGFTLIEVLAALLIFSVSTLGLVASVGHATRTATDIELRTLAGIVAENRIAEAVSDFSRFQGASEGVRVREGRDEQLGQRFDWRVELRPTAVDGFPELVVSVSQADQLILTRRTYRTSRFRAVSP